MVHAACWSHSRRKFVDAIKPNKLDAASISIVELMDKLFAIDARARDEKMNHTARHAPVSYTHLDVYKRQRKAWVAW